MTDEITVTRGSGNIFADLGLPDAENLFLKAQLVAELYRLTTSRKLSQAKVGALLGMSRPEVSRMFRGHFHEYSIERLMGFLTAFGHDADMVLKEAKNVLLDQTEIAVDAATFNRVQTWLDGEPSAEEAAGLTRLMSVKPKFAED